MKSQILYQIGIRDGGDGDNPVVVDNIASVEDAAPVLFAIMGAAKDLVSKWCVAPGQPTGMALCALFASLDSAEMSGEGFSAAEVTDTIFTQYAGVIPDPFRPGIIAYTVDEGDNYRCGVLSNRDLPQPELDLQMMAMSMGIEKRIENSLCTSDRRRSHGKHNQTKKRGRNSRGRSSRGRNTRDIDRGHGDSGEQTSKD